MHAGLVRVWKIPRQKWGDKEQKLIIRDQNGRTKEDRVRIGPSEGIFSLKNKQNVSIRRYKQSFSSVYTKGRIR